MTLTPKAYRLDMVSENKFKAGRSCANGTAYLEAEVALRTTAAVVWSAKKGEKPKDPATDPHFAKLAQEAEPILQEYEANCNRVPALDGGVVLPGEPAAGAQNNGSADAGM